jgi:predicted RNA-binding Zn-ribbon protein involved in translation (DUF1610 family)
MLNPVRALASCPGCGTEMVRGYLKGLKDSIHIETLQSLRSSALQAFVCPACGHVELRATDPKALANKDISDQEIEAFAKSR